MGHRDGTPCATPLATGHKPCANGTVENAAVAARRRPVRNQLEQSTDSASDKAEENAGDWMGKDSDGRRQQMEKQRQRKRQDASKGQPRDEPRQLRKLARIRPSRTCPSSKGCQREVGPRQKRESEQFLSLADKEKLALARDDEVDAATVLCLNMSCSQERFVTDEETPLTKLRLFQPQYGKLEEKLARS